MGLFREKGKENQSTANETSIVEDKTANDGTIGDETADGSDGSQKGSDKSNKESDALKKGSNASKKGSDDSKEGSDGSKKGSDDSKKRSNGSHKGSDASKKGSDGSKNGSDGSKKVSDGLKEGSDGSKKASDASRKEKGKPDELEKASDEQKTSQKTSEETERSNKVDEPSTSDTWTELTETTRLSETLEDTVTLDTGYWIEIDRTLDTGSAYKLETPKAKAAMSKEAKAPKARRQKKKKPSPKKADGEKTQQEAKATKPKPKGTDGSETKGSESTKGTVQKTESLKTAPQKPKHSRSKEVDLSKPSPQGIIPAKRMSEELKPSKRTSQEIKPSKRTSQEIKPSRRASEEIKPSKRASEEIKPSKRTSQEIKPSRRASEEIKPSKRTSDGIKPSKRPSQEFKPSKSAIQPVQAFEAAPETKQSKIELLEDQPLILHQHPPPPESESSKQTSQESERSKAMSKETERSKSTAQGTERSKQSSKEDKPSKAMPKETERSKFTAQGTERSKQSSKEDKPSKARAHEVEPSKLTRLEAEPTKTPPRESVSWGGVHTATPVARKSSNMSKPVSRGPSLTAKPVARKPLNKTGRPPISPRLQARAPVGTTVARKSSPAATSAGARKSVPKQPVRPGSLYCDKTGKPLPGLTGSLPQRTSKPPTPSPKLVWPKNRPIPVEMQGLICEVCYQMMAGKTVHENPKNKTLYCGDCHERMYCKTCQKCKSKIKPGETEQQYENKSYHATCLKCVVCRKIFGINPIFVHEEKLYCYPCASPTRRSFRVDPRQLPSSKEVAKCARCKGSFVGRDAQTMKISGRKYHLKCFRCDGCQKVFRSGEQVCDKNPKLLCITCVTAPCNKCGQRVNEGHSVTTPSGKEITYHNECALCSRCEKSLSERDISILEDPTTEPMIYCLACYDAINKERKEALAVEAKAKAGAAAAKAKTAAKQARYAAKDAAKAMFDAQEADVTTESTSTTEGGARRLSTP